MVSSMTHKVHQNGHSRGYFKGYKVTVGDSGITFARNYAHLGSNDLHPSKNNHLNPANSFQRSATVLPIVSTPRYLNKNNSSNSTFSKHDGSQSNSPSTGTPSGAPGPPGSPGVGLGLGLSHQMSSDDLKQFDRKLEREREKRINTDPPPVRLDGRVLPDSSQQCDFNMKRNGFRPTSKNSFMTHGTRGEQQPVGVAGFRHSHTPPVDPLGSFAITNSASQGPHPQGPQASASTPGTLRGQSIGYGSREGATGAGVNISGGRPTHLKTRSRSILLAGQSEKYRQNQYQFTDPVSGATPDFTQRLAELNTLEGDTMRYERTKKAKKKAKQDSG